MKVARPVWSGGKGGDNFKTLPIAIGSFYENEQCCGPGFQRFPEGYGYANENPVYQRKNQGRGVIMATGTPLSNSMVELYVMQLYLQERRLHEKGIYHLMHGLLCLGKLPVPWNWHRRVPVTGCGPGLISLSICRN